MKAAYAAYLGVLARAVEQIWDAARQQHADWQALALTALRDHRVHEPRFELALSAPTDIVRQAEIVAAKLTLFRQAVAEGASHGSEPYERVWEEYYKSREVMLKLMRADLGVSD